MSAALIGPHVQRWMVIGRSVMRSASVWLEDAFAVELNRAADIRGTASVKLEGSCTVGPRAHSTCLMVLVMPGRGLTHLKTALARSGPRRRRRDFAKCN